MALRVLLLNSLKQIAHGSSGSASASSSIIVFLGGGGCGSILEARARLELKNLV
jgi:hypothetical protein